MKKQRRNNIIKAIIIATIFIVAFLAVSQLEYKAYIDNNNSEIVDLVGSIKEKYPDVTNEEIIKILNDTNAQGREEKAKFLKDYGVIQKNESAVLANKNSYITFAAIEVLIIVGCILTLLGFYIWQDRKRQKEVVGITKYIEELNKRNYNLMMDELSEGELSILKNEVYKMTIMLREVADNSAEEKKNLKVSMEDISHQLKTPLTSIMVILDNLIDDPQMPAEIRNDFIKGIKRETDNINFLVQSLLKLAKLDSNTIDFIKKEITLDSIASKSITNASALSDLLGVEIVYDAGDLKEAKANVDFMWQVEAVTNIVKNCVEHSDRGSKVEISISENRVYSAIEIRDYAGGISDKDLPHIFERFYKGENATKDSVGIGLALAKSIVEKDNGMIIVDKVPGGSKFSIKYFK